MALTPTQLILWEVVIKYSQTAHTSISHNIMITRLILSGTSRSCQNSSDQPGLGKEQLEVFWSAWYKDINNRSFGPYGLGLLPTDHIRSHHIECWGPSDSEAFRFASRYLNDSLYNKQLKTAPCQNNYSLYWVLDLWTSRHMHFLVRMGLNYKGAPFVGMFMQYKQYHKGAILLCILKTK